eukprot:TRINITY_DN25598_c0_g2_i3.p2 TRINITY_DN25598_c0_g2~~TRINITY_DN25598_c0_g2_i3.p2  ORF type:complete len:237 (-),score=36.01 TRINITY_DN25598_c0_g2_i3:507-1217(-)
MPGSREEAMLCVRLAENARAEGQTDLALGFAEQANSLYKSPEIDNLLWSLRQPSAARPQYSHEGVTKSHASNAKSSTTVHVTAAPSEVSGALNTSYAIARVLEAKSNYYQVLGVDKSVGKKELRDAYNKLVLKLHPDVCNEPRAQEAFDVVNKAFSTLSDAHKRAVYDLKLEGSNALLPDAEAGDGTKKNKKKSKRLGLIGALIKWWSGGSLTGKLTFYRLSSPRSWAFSGRLCTA